jgi:hypothetical protein
MLMGSAMQLHAEVENFDAMTEGRLPAGWTTGVTGSGRANWVVTADNSAPSKPHVLMQKGPATFAWCVRDGVAFENGFVEVRFKPVSGREDQAGGVVWRWKNADNYYVARANALENNVSLYYTTHGKRSTIKYVYAPVAASEWHLLRVDFERASIKVALDNTTYIDESDIHLIGPGSVGMWTKADSVTAFDDFAYGPAAR